MATAARSRRLTTVVVAAAAFVACLLVLTSWRYWPWREKYTVAMPPPTASQQDVVRAYLRALDAHDSSTALALSDRSMRSTTQMWLSDTAGISQIKIGAVQYAARELPGEQYSVPTDFVFASHWWKDDPSFGDGEHYWEYWLIKINGRWLINDEGTG